MSEQAKTMGQVLGDALYEALFGDGKQTPDGTLSPVRGVSVAGRKAYSAAAAAVIAAHEAAQWRPMSDAAELNGFVGWLLRDSRSVFVVRQTTVDERLYWRDVESHEWYNTEELGGWQPLPAPPEVPR